jgi:hypothetical protein
MQIDMSEQIQSLIEYLKQVRVTEAYKQDDDNFYCLDADGQHSCDRSPAADIARMWCRELLDAADAEGLHGCKLCCG